MLSKVHEEMDTFMFSHPQKRPSTNTLISANFFITLISISDIYSHSASVFSYINSPSQGSFVQCPAKCDRNIFQGPLGAAEIQSFITVKNKKE